MAHMTPGLIFRPTIVKMNLLRQLSLNEGWMALQPTFSQPPLQHPGASPPLGRPPPKPGEVGCIKINLKLEALNPQPYCG